MGSSKQCDCGPREDGFRFTSGDNSASIQVGTLQQFDLADYDEDSAKLANGTDLRRSRLFIGGNFLTDWHYRIERPESPTLTSRIRASSR